MVLHGLVYVPESKLKIWAMPNTGAPSGFIFGSGLVTSSIEIASDDISGIVRFAHGPTATPTPRTVVVRASSVSPAGATRETVAVLTLAPDGTMSIDSWRVG